MAAAWIVENKYTDTVYGVAEGDTEEEALKSFLKKNPLWRGSESLLALSFAIPTK